MTQVTDVSDTERRVATVDGEELRLHTDIPGGPTKRLEIVLQDGQLMNLERVEDNRDGCFYIIHVYRPTGRQA